MGFLLFKVKHVSPEASGEDNWCWEQSFIDVDVGAEDVKGIEFVQKGYWLNVIASHDVDAYMTQPDTSPVTLKIKVLSLTVYSPKQRFIIYQNIICIPR